MKIPCFLVFSNQNKVPLDKMTEEIRIRQVVLISQFIGQEEGGRCLDEKL